MMKIGIIGAGDIANRVSPAITGVPGELIPYAIASRDLAKAQAFADKWGYEKAYGSYDEMLADPEVDLVYVATPHTLHYEHAKMCIEAGKPVLVEKPFMVNAEQAEEIFALAEEKKVFVSEAMWTRYMPGVKVLQDAVRSGIIGEARMLTADMSYPMMDKPRIVDPNLAGGALLDVGCYSLHFAAMVFGSENVQISGVCTQTDRGVDAQESMSAVWPDGKLAVLTSSAQVNSPREGIVYGDKGYIVAGHVGNIVSVKAYDPRGNLLQDFPVPSQINGYEYEFLACKKALEEGETECAELPHAETLVMMEWMDALRKQWGVVYPFEK